MSVSIQAGNMLSFLRTGGTQSSQDKAQRQQKCASQVDFFEKQKENLKNMECTTLEDIARKLDMFHSYEDQIAEVKKQYNSSQIMHVLDEAKEIGEKIAEEAEKMAPKSAEELREDKIEEAAGTEEESKGMLTEIMEEITEVMDEMEEELEEELDEELKDGLDIGKEQREELESAASGEDAQKVQDESTEQIQNESAEQALDVKEKAEDLAQALDVKEVAENLAQALDVKEVAENLAQVLDAKEVAEALDQADEEAAEILDGSRNLAAGRKAAEHPGDTLAEAVQERIIRERMEKRAEEKAREETRHKLITEAEDVRKHPHIDYRL